MVLLRLPILGDSIYLVIDSTSIEAIVVAYLSDYFTTVARLPSSFGVGGSADKHKCTYTAWVSLFFRDIEPAKGMYLLRDGPDGSSLGTSMS